MRTRAALAQKWNIIVQNRNFFGASHRPVRSHKAQHQ